jgi:hypothetical protein
MIKENTLEVFFSQKILVSHVFCQKSNSFFLTRANFVVF